MFSAAFFLLCLSSLSVFASVLPAQPVPGKIALRQTTKEQVLARQLRAARGLIRRQGSAVAGYGCVRCLCHQADLTEQTVWNGRGTKLYR